MDQNIESGMVVSSIQEIGGLIRMVRKVLIRGRTRPIRSRHNQATRLAA